ncbi:hypothetical protein OXX80_002527 [Metschnikowia pulcherrima]
MLLSRLTVFPAGILAVRALAEGSSEHVKLDFTISKDVHTGTAKRDDSVGLDLINTKNWYTVKIKVGSEEDESTVILDTSSADLWVIASDVDCYARDQGTYYNKREDDDGDDDPGFPTFTLTPNSTFPLWSPDPEISNCTASGSFNTGSSTSFHRNESVPPFQFDRNDPEYTFAKGFYATDIVNIGNVSIPEFQFGVANYTSAHTGILGIGFPRLESSNAKPNRERAYTYSNFPMRLKESGAINKIVYSMYMDSLDAPSGSIVFGAVDHAKYSGQLQTIPMVNLFESDWQWRTPFDVALSSVTLESSTQNVTISELNVHAFMEPRCTFSSFPYEIIETLATSLDAYYLDIYHDFPYEVSCNYNTDKAFVVFNFSGARIRVPLADLIVESDSQCYLGILQWDRFALDGHYVVTLGENFLRRAYVVYDLEDHEISLAQVKWTSDEDVEVITSTVPSATRASKYSESSISTHLEEISTVPNFTMDVTPIFVVDGMPTTTGSTSGHKSSQSASTSAANGFSSGSATNDASVFTHAGVIIAGIIGLYFVIAV